MDRTRLACDRCHKRKIRCINSLQGCRQCTELGIVCKSDRPLLKPGRKPTTIVAAVSVENAGPKQFKYPVLQKLRAHGVGDALQQDQFLHKNPICSTDDACMLLENFFSSPDQVPHGMILRRAYMLRTEGYRETNAALLFSILCISCYMPTAAGEPPLPHLGYGDRARLCNALHAAALELLEPVFLNKIDGTFDDAVATYTLCCVSSSDDEHHRYLPHRTVCFNFLIKQVQLNLVRDSLTAEEKEERRRLWWAAYIIDKHSSFSFNLRPTLAESECRFVHRPSADELWLTDEALPDDDTGRVQGLGFEVHTLDWFGVFVPLAAILSDLLEYHYLRQHPSLGSKTGLLSTLKKTIEENMDFFCKSVHHLHDAARGQSRMENLVGVSVMVWDAGELRDLESEFPSEPKLLLYAWHMLHCMYTLLYGKLDPVDIFQDTEWLLSSDFLTATAHADKCTKILAQILRLDPKLYGHYRLFGTYFLHSSFIFLILARKLRHSADDYLLNSCRTYLRTLEAFAATVNIKYQRTFARVLQDTISACVEAQNQPQPQTEEAAAAAAAAAADDWLDTDILNYRWTAGHGGLWNGEMGRNSESKKKKT